MTITASDKREAIERGVEAGIFKEGSQYEGDSFYYALTENFWDTYQEELNERKNWEDAMRATIKRLAVEDVSIDTMANISIILRAIAEEKLKNCNTTIEAYL